MSTETLKANTEWLVWARESVHFDKKEVAKLMNIDEETLTNWENTGEITYSKLNKLADVYQVSPHLFFNDNKPTYEKDIPDFRTINSEKISVTPNLMFELRRARQKRETILNLIEDLDDVSVPEFLFKNYSYNNPRETSDYLKGILDIKRKNYGNGLYSWINIVESLGILVFEFYDISPSDLRGYALYYDELPIIGINHRDSDNAKKFTLFHELIHLIIKKEGISDINEYFIKNEDERICNKIAAELLVPSDMFKKFVNDYSFSKFRESDIQRLSKLFHVSKHVIVRKALNLGYISHSVYSSRIDEFNNYINPKKSKRKNKTKNNKKPDVTKVVDPSKNIHKEAKIALNKNGEYFINLLFKAYDENLISDLDVALELDVSLNGMYEIIRIMGEDYVNS